MKLISLAVLVSTPFFCHGQYYHKRDTLPKRNLRQITITLSPIVIQNGKYYFEGRRIQFEEFALALVSVHDNVVDHRLKVVRTLTDLRPFVFYGGSIYLTYLAINLPPTRGGFNTYINNIIGVFVFETLYRLSISIAKRSAINRYNDVVLLPTADVTSGGSISIGLKARF